MESYTRVASSHNPPLRVLLYGRTSADKSEGRSVDDQLSELRRWADREGHVVVGEERDDGASASRFARGKQRAGWQRALDALASGDVGALGVWEVSRSTRDRAVWAALIAGLIEAGAPMIVGGKVHDPADPDDGFMLDLGAALAVRESAMTSKRVLRAVEVPIAPGHPRGVGRRRPGREEGR